MPRKILIIADWYLPGYMAGGQVTAVSNLVELIGDSFEIFIFTRDRDLTDEKPYSGICADEWLRVGKALVRYTQNLSLSHLRRWISAIRPDVIYLNSVFSILAIRTLCLRHLGLLPDCAIVLAPRGEFSPGALNIKKSGKWVFVNCASLIGLYRGVVWQASSELERGQIATRLRAARVNRPCIRVASDPPSPELSQAAKAPHTMTKGNGARFLFMSRVSRIKNLLFALDLVGELAGHVEFDVFGPLDDPEYWQQCQKKIDSLPPNVVVCYRGTVPHEFVLKVAAEYDFFLLPTQGENFGYAILEAMAAGCPIVVSDRTPWQQATEQGAGWCLPLEDRDLWRHVLQQCVDMEPQTYAKFSAQARRFVEAWITSSDHRAETIQLFNSALNLGGLPSPATPFEVPSTGSGRSEQHREFDRV